MAFHDRLEAESALENPLSGDFHSYSTKVDPFDGKPILINIQISGRTSPCGREIARYQQGRYLVVTAQTRDSRQLAKLVEIPDCRESRKVNVSLP
jgi:hypothetical protein